MNPPVNHPSPPSRERVGVIVVGSVLVLLGLAALVAGAGLLAVHESQRDVDGFYSSGQNRVSTPTSALVADDLSIGADTPGWLTREDRLGTIRVTATGTPSQPVFLGVGRRAEVDAYLRGVAQDRVADLELDPFALDVARRKGSRSAGAPGDRPFWARAATGSGVQTLDWPVEAGEWAVVVMNADGSPGIRTAVTIGAKLGIVLWIAVALLVAGGFLVVGGGTAMFLGVRHPHDRRQRPRTPAAVSA